MAKDKLVPHAYYLKWIDSVSHRLGWNNTPIDEIEESYIESVGYIVDENERWYLISHSVGTHEARYEGDFHDIFLIPKSCVIEKRKLNVNKTK